MTVYKTYKHLLTNYPNIFSCPLDVSCHLFAVIGNGYEWSENGELADCVRGDDYLLKDKDDPLGLPERDERLLAEVPHLYAQFGLQDEAKRIKYKFILDNMEDVLRCSPDTSFFGSNICYGHYVVKNICLKYAHGLNFPANITDDWAKTLHKFLNWWLYNLNCVYGLSHKGESGPWWGQNALDAYEVIKKTRDEVNEIIQLRAGVNPASIKEQQ